MSETSGRIGLLLSTEAVISCFCYHNNNPIHNGIILRDHYGSEDAAWNLIHPGDIRQLNAIVGWDEEPLDVAGPLYFRDRGDRDATHIFSLNKSEYFELSKETSSIYSFLFNSKKMVWECYSIAENYGNEVKISEP